MHLALAGVAMASCLKSLPPLAAGYSRLYLCRHGETDCNAQSLLQGSGVDAVLNAVGKAQAANLAEKLACIRLDVVASSTLARAVETADIVAKLQPAEAERESHAGQRKASTPCHCSPCNLLVQSRCTSLTILCL